MSRSDDAAGARVGPRPGLWGEARPACGGDGSHIGTVAALRQFDRADGVTGHGDGFATVRATQVVTTAVDGAREEVGVPSPRDGTPMVRVRVYATPADAAVATRRSSVVGVLLSNGTSSVKGASVMSSSV